MSNVPEYLGKGELDLLGDPIEEVVEAEVAKPTGIQRVAPKHAPKTIPGIIYAYAWLGLLVGAAAFALVNMSFDHVRVETKTVSVVPKSASGLIKALGITTDTPGEQINPNLKGASCGAYQPKDGLIIICR